MVEIVEMFIAAVGAGVAVFALALYSRTPNGIVEDEEGSQFKMDRKTGEWHLVRESFKAKQRKDDEARAQQQKVLAEIAAKATAEQQPATS